MIPKSIGCCVGVVWTVILCFSPASARSDGLDEEIRALESFTRTYHLIQSKYVEHRTVDQLVRFAIEGMVSGLDPYSEVIDEDELAKLKSDATGRFAGIGISVQHENDRPVVTQVLKGSPSEKAGLMEGDVLVQVDDIKLSGRKYKSLIPLVRGKAGTTLTVSFYHPGNPDQVIRKTIRREMVKFPSPVEIVASPLSVAIDTPIKPFP